MNRPRGPTRGDRPRIVALGPFLAVAYAFVVVMLGTNLPTPLYPIYQREVGFSALMVTVIFATYAFGVITGLVLFGRTSDQIGRRPMLLAGLGLSASSALAFLLQGGVPILLVGRFVSGLSSGIFTGTATATLVDLAPASARGRATLVATAANMGGLGVGPFMAGVLAEWLPGPLHLCFLIDLVLVAIAVAVVLRIPEPVQRRSRFAWRVQRPRVPPEVRTVFAGAATAGFAGFAVLGLYSGVSSSFLVTVLDLNNRALAGLVVLLVFGSSLLGQLLLGRVPDRGALPGGCALLVLGMGVLAAGLWLEMLGLVMGGGVIAGTGQGLSFRSGLAAVNQASPPHRRGEVASSYFVVAYSAVSIPIIGVGVVARAVGLRTAGLVFTGGVALLAISAGALLLRRREAPATPSVDPF